MNEEVKNCLMDCACLIKGDDWAIRQKARILKKTENLIENGPSK